MQEAVVKFVTETTNAMGLSLSATTEQTGDGVRVNLEGAGADVLLRHGAEALQALQHVTNMVFKHELDENQRIVVDCEGFRREKDVELRHMAKYLAERTKRLGVEQKLGPLNPYERRIVHMVVAEEGGLDTHSEGESFMKTVIISVRK